MPLSKSKRFKVFKRDEFTCQYCGQRPPAIILEVDHIHPRSKGGTDDEINLITSCMDCNRGKSDKVLGDIHPRPDADIKYLESQQEIAEARRYLESASVLDELNSKIQRHLVRLWCKHITAEYSPSDGQWASWLGTYSPEEIEYGLARAGIKYNRQYDNFGGSNPDWILLQIIRYASAVMRNVKKEAEEGG